MGRDDNGIPKREEKNVPYAYTGMVGILHDREQGAFGFMSGDKTVHSEVGCSVCPVCFATLLTSPQPLSGPLVPRWRLLLNLQGSMKIFFIHNSFFEASEKYPYHLIPDRVDCL